MPFSARTGFFSNKDYPDPAFPFWPEQANTSVYTTEFNLYSGADAGTLSANIGGIHIDPRKQYKDSILHPNGNIYMTHGKSGNTLEINLLNNTSTERNPHGLLQYAGNSSVQFQGGVAGLGKNGNIYVLPSLTSSLFNVMYEYSPNTNSARFIDTGTIFSNVILSGDPYATSSMDATGNVWFMPFSQGNGTGGGFLKIDCSTEPVTIYGNISFGRTWGGDFADQKRWGGHCHHPNGNIYCAGYDYTFAGKYILEIDPVANTFTEHGTIDGTFAQNGSTSGCFPGADGNIYTIPNNMHGIAKLDVSTGTIYQSDYGLDWWSQFYPASPNMYMGAVSSPNGNTYLGPKMDSGNSSLTYNILKIDTRSNTVILGANVDYTNVSIRSGIIADRSRIMLMPQGEGANTTVREIWGMDHNGTGGTNPTNFVLSPFNNT